MKQNIFQRFKAGFNAAFFPVVINPVMPRSQILGFNNNVSIYFPYLEVT